MKLKKADVKSLSLCVNAGGRELRKDLNTFVDYVWGGDIKRARRTNWLPKTVARKLAALMTDPDAATEVSEEGYSSWIDFVDELALMLGFITYDTEGEYAGYSSREPSFPDNYIEVKEKDYERFLASPLADQEQRILDMLVGHFADAENEFFERSVLGRLELFDMFGCATAIVPTLKFDRIRRYLLNVLARCESNVWLSTASLVAILKNENRFFLIPQKLPASPRGWSEKYRRYENFSECRGKNRYSGSTKEIKEREPDAFERVEGRYVERFLEGIPLVLGYVDVAYEKESSGDVHPPPPFRLQAFRVHDCLSRVLKKEVPEPTVRVQPNFEIYVESELHPAGVLSQLALLGDIVTEDRVSILRLSKEKVAAAVAADEKLDVRALLDRLSAGSLPKNVAAELDAWCRHADMVTLYDGFALLEGTEGASVVESLTEEKISPRLRIIPSPDEAFVRLENADLVPLMVGHAKGSFKELPETAKTAFPRKGKSTKPQRKRKVILKRKTSMTIFFPSDEVFTVFLKKLVAAQCYCVPDKKERTITLSAGSRAAVTNAVRELRDVYTIKVEDVE